MLNIPITQNLGVMVYDGSFPRNDFDTKEQKKTAEGVPIWSVNIFVHQQDARRSDAMTINIPCPHDPNEDFSVFDKVQVGGLRVMTGENDGAKWVSFAADSLSPLAAKQAPAK